MRAAAALVMLAACCSADPWVPACAALPDCTTQGAAPAPEAEYGQVCASSLGAVEWRGEPWCCAKDTVYARCVNRALAGEHCDPAARASCADGLRCVDDTAPTCAGAP